MLKQRKNSMAWRCFKWHLTTTFWRCCKWRICYPTGKKLKIYILFQISKFYYLLHNNDKQKNPIIIDWKSKVTTSFNSFQVQYLKDFAATHKLKGQYNTYIKNVTRENGQYLLKDDNKNEYNCKRVIVRWVLPKTYVWIFLFIFCLAH